MHLIVVCVVGSQDPRGEAALKDKKVVINKILQLSDENLPSSKLSVEARDIVRGWSWRNAELPWIRAWV